MTEATRDSGLKPELLEELQEDFSFADDDQDGHIDFGEFSSLLDNLGAEMSDAELRIGFREIDTDRDGRINLAEFVAWWAPK
jgi:Ca2+-binding EF-hand superfamily protein